MNDKGCSSFKCKGFLYVTRDEMRWRKQIGNGGGI